MPEVLTMCVDGGRSVSHEAGVRSAIGTPITVEGRLWEQ
jgi:hypothetical protein